MLFDIEHLTNINEIAKLTGFEDAGLETAQAVLEGCARFNQDVVAPLNIAGDRNPSSFKGGDASRCRFVCLSQLVEKMPRCKRAVIPS
ncbi:hypothetical protein SRS16P2_00428 (plasmid) [Variovorax sp. SRS16]|nr:hypothetical protein SRS16P2_00428 [Variovorax sp. SRS16]